MKDAPTEPTFEPVLDEHTLPIVQLLAGLPATEAAARLAEHLRAVLDEQECALRQARDEGRREGAKLAREVFAERLTEGAADLDSVAGTSLPAGIVRDLREVASSYRGLAKDAGDTGSLVSYIEERLAELGTAPAPEPAAVGPDQHVIGPPRCMHGEMTFIRDVSIWARAECGCVAEHHFAWRTTTWPSYAADLCEMERKRRAGEGT